jgi:hypothetical protein
LADLKPFTFSPDSKQWAYPAHRGRTVRAVVSLKEYGSYDFLGEEDARDEYIYFSPDSRHFAFMATRGNQAYIAVDGAAERVKGEWLPGSRLRFDTDTKLHGLLMDKEKVTLLEIEIQ